MKVIRFGAVVAGVICLVVLLPGTALSRVHFGISVGTSGFHDYSGYHFGGHPYYRWHDGYYRWLDHGRYVWLDRGRYMGPCGFIHRPFYRRRPFYSSGFSVRIRDCWPVVLGPPILTGVPRAVTRRGAVVTTPPTAAGQKPKYDENTARLFAKLRRKKSELLRTLSGAEQAQRKKAIADLAGFSFDDKVRGALEDILLSEADAELRKEAVRSFGKVKNRRALPALEKARTEDSDREVREEAEKAIRKIRGY